MDVDLGVKNLFSVFAKAFIMFFPGGGLGVILTFVMFDFFFLNDDHSWLLQRLSNDAILKILSR